MPAGATPALRYRSPRVRFDNCDDLFPHGLAAVIYVASRMPDDVDVRAAGAPLSADQINPFSEVVDRILVGAIDLHCHSGPSVMPRNINHIEMMHDAAANGLRAVLVKDHYYSAQPVTKLLNEHYHETVS